MRKEKVTGIVARGLACSKNLMFMLIALAALSPSMASAQIIFNELQAGSGWLGPTEQPDAIGSPHMKGFTADAICRWDVVPFQTIDSPFDVGVVAFHMNGIDRVEIAADGGEWMELTEPTLNKRTGVVEYFATIDPADFEDGRVELRARVFPRNAGQPVVLQGEVSRYSVWDGYHSMIVYTNANSTLQRPVRYVSPSGSDDFGTGTRSNPFQTIFAAALDVQNDHGSADGATIRLEAGSYLWGGADGAFYPESDSRWITIESAPGVARDAVRLDSVDTGGLKTRKVHLKDLTVDGIAMTSVSGGICAIWVDNCVMEAGGRLDNHLFLPPTTWASGIYLTRTTIREVQKAMSTVNFAREVLIHDIGSDAFKNARLVLNSTVRDIDNTDVAPHPDVLQFHGSEFDNIIVYGLKAVENIDAQGIFVRRDGNDGHFDNSAFINVILKSEEYAGQWQHSADHLVMWHFVHLTRPFWMRDDSYDDDLITRLRNVSIRNCVFDSLIYDITDGPKPLELSDNCHFVRYDPVGTNATTGDPMFVDEDALDFHPLPESPLQSRVDEILVPFDLEMNSVASSRDIGALQGIGAKEETGATLVDYEFAIGERMNGSIHELLNSDDQYLVGRSRFGFLSAEPNVIELVTTFQTDIAHPSEMIFSLESRLNMPEGSGSASFRVWHQDRLSQIGQFNTSMHDKTIDITPSSPARFVHDTTGEIEVHTKMVVVATFTLNGFNAYFDRTLLEVER